MKNFNIIDKQGIKLNTANTYVNDDINNAESSLFIEYNLLWIFQK